MNALLHDENNELEQGTGIEELLDRLSQDPDKEQTISEIGVLQSIYGNDSIKTWKPSDNGLKHNPAVNDDKVRYLVHLDLPPPFDNPDTQIRVLVTLSPSYPRDAAPQLQLLSRYIGAFSVDSNLFGSVLRTFISRDGIKWVEDAVCVFDGLENVRERCGKWYGERLGEEEALELQREDEKERERIATASDPRKEGRHDAAPSIESDVTVPLPSGVEFFIAEPIAERKSVFIGRACRITDPSQVPVILAHLLSDRRIARAAHPIINAWRCTINGIVHQDNDDDGETAAGGRIAHLLQILEVNNVLVVVTRYFGGTLLGPDRFKFINQAARNALELGGFLDAHDEKMAASRSRRKT